MKPAEKPVPKPDDVKVISIDALLLPGAIAGQISLTIYGLGDDGKIYTYDKNKNWVFF